MRHPGSMGGKPKTGASLEETAHYINLWIEVKPWILICCEYVNRENK